MICSTKVERRHVRARRWLLLLSTAAGVALGQPAFAQLAAPAPVRPSVDANGVDLFLGTFNARATPMVLGKASQGLTYQQVNTGSGWTDNSTVSLNQSGNVMTVAIGGASDAFLVSGSTYTSTEGSGATLTASGNVFTYTQSDGSVIHFNKTMAGDYPYYSNYGRVTDITSPSGLTETFAYYSVSYCSRSKPGGGGQVCTLRNNAYRVTTVTSSAGYSLTFNYGDLDPYDPNDPNNQLNFQQFSTPVSVSSTNTATNTAGSSETLSNSTDANGYTVRTITDPAGRSTLYRSNVYGVARIMLPGSSSDDIAIAYSSSGRVTGVTAGGSTTTYNSSDNGSTGERTVTVTDPASNVTTYVFDLVSARAKRVTDALGHVTSTTYDANGRVTQVVHPEGDGLGYGYDGYGNVTSVTALAKGGGTQPVSTAYYPCSSTVTCNKPQWTRDARNNQTDYLYDPTTGQVTSVTAPADTNGGRPQTRYSYTSVGGVSLPTTISQCRTSSSCTGGADETRVSIAYNSNLLPTAVTKAAGDSSLSATTAFSYDAVGNVVSIDGPLPGSADTTNVTYDADREVTSVISPDPDGGGPLQRRAAVYHYLPSGLRDSVVVGTTDANGNNFAALQTMVTAYDANYRKVSDTASAGGTTYAVTQYSYEAAGRLDCTAVRMNPSAFGSLPGACSLGSAGAYGNDRITKVALYDALNRVTQLTTAYGTPEASTEQTSFTWNGKTETVTDADNNVTSYGYDGFDRLSTTTYPGGSYEQLGYDANGNVTSRRLRDGQTLTYDYDALNRRTYDHNPGTNVAEKDVSYTYDNLGRLLQAYDGNGWTKIFEYDALGRVTREHSNIADNYLQYDAAGRRTRQTWGDGFFVTYDYDTLGEMTAIHENGGFVLASFGYDDLGRRTSLSRGNGTSTSYGYDAASRLTSLSQSLVGASANQSFTYGYNPAGQITSRTASNDAYAWTGAYNVDRSYGVNGLNQYTSAGGTTFGYDGRGNLTNSGGTTYGYNSRNQLFQGPQGQLIYHNPAGELGQVPGTNFDWVGGQLATESGSAIQRRYVYGPGADEPLVWYEGSGTNDRRWLHADDRGSVIAVSDGAGNASTINTYDEYGIPGASNSGRFQYTGQAWLPEIGLYDYKGRMYSPTLGRFMQTDPIGYGDGINWYNYVGSDPVNATDPSGMAKYTFTCDKNGHCTWTSSDGRSGTYDDKTGNVTVNGVPGVFGKNDIYVTGTRENNTVMLPLSISRVMTTPQNVDPPCKTGVDCKLPTLPNPCTIANNYCGPKPPTPPLPKPKPPTDWKHVRTCLGAGGAFAAGVAFLPETFGGSLAAVLMGGAAIQQCADS